MNMPRAPRPGRLLIRAIWAGTAFAASLPFFAQALVSPAQTGPWYKQIQVDTFLSASYSYNFNRPGDHALQYRVFDIKDDQAMLDVASLTVQKAAEKPGGFGFRLDMGAGQSQPEVTAASGFFRSSRTGEAGHFDVEQAYVSYVANVGRGLRFDLGKYYAPIGYESVERYDAYNDNATHSFLFGYCGPFTTTGLKISYPFSKQWSGMVMVVQGWDNVKDNNSGKSVEAQVAYTPNDAFSLYLSCLGGPEQTDNTSNMRQAYDLCATWQAFQALSLGLNVDYGHERNALGPGKSGTWHGFAGYAVYGFTDRLRLGMRAEQFDDPDGARTGTPQRLREVTLTPSYRIGGHFVVRADLREDWSDRNTFNSHEGPTDRQTTATFNVLFVY
jgi:hypothetical protein